MTRLSRATVSNVATLVTVGCGAVVVVMGVIRGSSVDLAVGAGLLGGPAAFNSGRATDERATDE